MAQVGGGDQSQELNRKLANAVAKMQSRTLAGSLPGGWNTWRSWTCATSFSERSRGFPKKRAAAHAFSTGPSEGHRDGAPPHSYRARREEDDRTVGFIFEQWRKWVDFKPREGHPETPCG